MMSFKLRMEFRGVLAWVPDSPFFEKDGAGQPISGEPKNVWVLVPDLLEPELADWDRSSPGHSKPDIRKTHLALLSVAEKYVVPADRDRFPKAMIRGKGGKGEKFLLLPLLNLRLSFPFLEKLSVDSFVPELEVPVAERRDIIMAASTPKEKQSLWWLPRLEDISSDFSYARRSLSPDNKNADLKKIGLTATLLIDRGRLLVEEFNAKGIWKFCSAVRSGDQVVPGENDRVWGHVIGVKVVWEVMIDDGAIDLQCKFKDDSQFTVRLNPPSQSEQEVTLTISNREPEFEFLPEPKKSSENKFDPDFQVFYDLAENTQQEATPRRFPLDDGPIIGLDGKPCAGGVYRGFSSK
jgi:hypothetical protein